MATETNPTNSSDARSTYALVVAIVGLLIPALLIGYLTDKSGTNAKWEATSIIAAAALFTTIVGTLVGAFLGVQVGAAGKQQAEDRAKVAEGAKSNLMGILTQEQLERYNLLK